MIQKYIMIWEYYIFKLHGNIVLIVHFFALRICVIYMINAFLEGIAICIESGIFLLHLNPERTKNHLKSWKNSLNWKMPWFVQQKIKNMTKCDIWYGVFLGTLREIRFLNSETFKIQISNWKFHFLQKNVNYAYLERV